MYVSVLRVLYEASPLILINVSRMHSYRPTSDLCKARPSEYTIAQFDGGFVICRGKLRLDERDSRPSGRSASTILLRVARDILLMVC